MQPPPFPQPAKGRNLSAATPGDRGNYVWRAQDFRAWIRAGGLNWNMLGKSVLQQRKEGDYHMDDINVEYEKANDVITRAQTAYNKTLQDFRSTIKNDIASISSSASKVQAEAAKISLTCTAAIATMNSPEMVAAIANAERLAAALSAISQVQPNKIAFAVIENKPPA